MMIKIILFELIALLSSQNAQSYHDDLYVCPYLMNERMKLANKP